MHNRTRYQWKRFWCPPDGKYSLADRGFLVDPEGEFGRALQPDLVAFDAIAEVPCLVLLGEPGTGKTFALADLVREREGVHAAPGGRVHHDDLGQYNTDTGIRDEIFGCDAFTDWAESDDVLELFLDSLDECIVEMRSVAKLLVEQLRKCDLTRLRLRLVCRTAVWPGFLEQDLRELWGDADVRLYELVPLRRKDMLIAAEQRGVDASGFGTEVIDKDAVPFAIKPITLEMLLDAYRETGAIPSTQAELYRQGCLRLCAARGHRRQEEGDLTYEQRLAVAERIAALTLFGRRTAICRDVGDSVALAGGVITVSEMVGEPAEPVDGSTLRVDRHVVEEVLGTGLFTSRGRQLLGWGHKSYEEFLAAQYLIRHELLPEQIADLVFRPAAPGEAPHLVPQLRETAVWLAVAIPEIMERIAAIDPRLLLRRQVAELAMGVRARLTEALLQLEESGRAEIHDFGLSDRYEVLAHPGLEDKLRPYIEDTQKRRETRALAIDIARSCKAETLVSALLTIAISDGEELRVRECAARAVAEIGDAAAKRQLRSLLSAGDADENDQLKAYALRALWPAELSAEELFAALTPPKRQLYHGAYQYFISNDLLPGGVPKIV